MNDYINSLHQKGFEQFDNKIITFKGVQPEIDQAPRVSDQTHVMTKVFGLNEKGEMAI